MAWLVEINRESSVPSGLSEPIVIRFSGEFDISRYPEMRAALGVCPEGTGPILIDLSETTLVDSIFLSELLLFKRRCAKNRKFAVLALDGNVLRTLALASVTESLNVFRDRQTALDALQSSS